MIDIEHCRLRALEQQLLAFLDELVELGRYVANHRLQPFRHQQRRLIHRVHRYRFNAKILRQHEVVIVEHFHQLFAKAFREQQIVQADGTARDFVFIGGPDAAPGRAELHDAHLRFARLIDRNMVRKDQWTGRRNAQPTHDIKSGGSEFVDFLQ